MIDILKSWLRKLTNLTGNNKSLFQLRLSKTQDLDIHELDFLNGNPSFNIIAELMQQKKTIKLCERLDPRNANVNQVSQRIKKIQRRDNFIFEERGARDLYVGWPYISGKFSDDTSVRCPLLFFPVEITEKENCWHLNLRKDVPITFNKSFLLAYSHFNSIKLEDEFVDKEISELNKDPQTFRNELYNVIKGSPIEVNFNQELFEDKLTHFTDFQKADFINESRTGELKLIPQAVLGIFPQAGSYLVPDYLHLVEKNQFESVEDFFVKKSPAAQEETPAFNNSRFIREIREELTFTPYKFDASQENAIKASKKGHSVVVHGPPGTGKSQLICNLISDYIARGKNVLVVCQKRAALDVVYSRLQEKGIHDFTALVHDFKNDRKSIYDQIDRQIERIEEFRQQNNSLDSVFLERNFIQASRKIDQLTEELDEFRTALFNADECGISPKELYLSSDPNKQAISLKYDYREFDLSRINDFIEKLGRYIPYHEFLGKQEHPWFDRVSFKDFGISDLQEINKLLHTIPEYEKQFEESVSKLLEGDSFTVQQSDWVRDREDVIEGLLSVLDDPTIFKYFKHFLHKKTDKDWLIVQEKRLFELYENHGIESSLDNTELNIFLGKLEKCVKARKRPLKWMFYWLFSKDKYLIKKVIVANNLPWSKKSFRQLQNKIDNRLNFEHSLTLLHEVDWLIDTPDTLDYKKLKNWFDDTYLALEAKEYSEILRSFRQYWHFDKHDYSTLKHRMTGIITLCREAAIKKVLWLTYFTSSQITKLLENEKYKKSLEDSLKKDFDSICEYDKVVASFSETETSILKTLKEEAPEDSFDTLSNLFQNSIRIAWINHMEMKYPILRSVSSLEMEQKEIELQKNIKEKRKISRDILLLKAREATYRNVEYNRLRNMVTYRDLKHQVSKKRKIWPIRKTLAEHNEEVFQLIPCWLASPESVSAIFPMEATFDLVIFDEASQCFSEKGIPAMYRGRQLVIAGDEKQLSPNDLYQVRYEEEEEDHPDLEIDSLLDLSVKYLMGVKLEGHYRSRSIDLIEFSNKHFYDHGLRLLPDFKEINQQDPGITYRKIEGIWEGGCNPIEAEEVVKLATELIYKGEKQIGIVTFNFKQQQLIQDLLEQKSLESEFLIPSELFVKNIENVQGDERNIIIFSIGYAPDIRGRLHMQFGTLNMEKGENRLNVAITRAKEKIYVLSSIMPQQLAVEDTKHPGPKLFKKYLEYAWNVSESNHLPSYFEKSDFRKDWYLKSKLTDELNQKNEFLKEELPFADLTIKTNGQYHGLVLTDDELYFQAISVKDSHAYVPLSLKSKHWKFQKVYSRQLWANREETLNSLKKFLEKVH